MDDRELVIRTGSLTKRSGRVLALDGMSVDAFPAFRHVLTGKATSEAARASTARWSGDMPCRKGLAARAAAATSIMVAITAILSSE